jgi:hypothetical protein
LRFTAEKVIPECVTVLSGNEYSPLVALMVVPLSRTIAAFVTATETPLNISEEKLKTAFEVPVIR